MPQRGHAFAARGAVAPLLEAEALGEATRVGGAATEVEDEAEVELGSLTPELGPTLGFEVGTGLNATLGGGGGEEEGLLLGGGVDG